MRRMKAPLILLKHDWPATSGKFYWADGPVECWTDAELCTAVLWCIEAQGLHHCPADCISFIFGKMCEAIQNEWELRCGKNAAWMMAQFAYARQANPGLSRNYDRLQEAEEKRQRAAQGHYPKFIVGWRVRHDKFGTGSVVKQEGNVLTIDFDSGQRKRVQRSFVTQIYGTRAAHTPSSAELREELSAYNYTPQPDGPNNAA